VDQQGQARFRSQSIRVRFAGGLREQLERRELDRPSREGLAMAAGEDQREQGSLVPVPGEVVVRPVALFANREASGPAAPTVGVR